MLCRRELQGLYRQGFKCVHCHQRAHRSCLDRVIKDPTSFNARRLVPCSIAGSVRNVTPGALAGHPDALPGWITDHTPETDRVLHAFHAVAGEAGSVHGDADGASKTTTDKTKMSRDFSPVEDWKIAHGENLLQRLRRERRETAEREAHTAGAGARPIGTAAATEAKHAARVKLWQGPMRVIQGSKAYGEHVPFGLGLCRFDCLLSWPGVGTHGHKGAVLS